MPSSEQQRSILLLLAQLLVLLNVADEHLPLLYDQANPQRSQYHISPPQRRLPPRDLYAEFVGTPMFHHIAGCAELMFDYLWQEMGQWIPSPQDIHFEYDDVDNLYRKWRPSKLTPKTRLLLWLHDFTEGATLKSSAAWAGVSASTLSRDYRHIGRIFMKHVYPKWVRSMDAIERNLCRLYPGYPSAFCSVDGSMFPRTRRYTLLPGQRPKDGYDFKNNWADSINANVVCNALGYATHILTGTPGRTCDLHCSRMFALDLPPRSCLADRGYRGGDRRWIVSDGSRLHKSNRVHVEFKFSSTKVSFSKVGGKYRRSKAWHGTDIRIALALDNIQRFFGGQTRYETL